MTGLVKTMKTDDGEIKMVGNALTFLIYKSYFGTDLLNDIVAFARKNADSVALSKIGELKIKTVEDLNSLDGESQAELIASIKDYSFDSEFVLNFMAALIATARYPTKPDIMELIMEIPPSWVADREVISDLMSFLSVFIAQKKKIDNSAGTDLGIETDFTTQMLYAALKSGITVTLADFGLNVLFDLMHYSAELDARVLAVADGNGIRKNKPMTVADMTKAGRLKA